MSLIKDLKAENEKLKKMTAAQEKKNRMLHTENSRLNAEVADSIEGLEQVQKLYDMLIEQIILKYGTDTSDEKSITVPRPSKSNGYIESTWNEQDQTWTLTLKEADKDAEEAPAE